MDDPYADINRDRGVTLVQINRYNQCVRIGIRYQQDKGASKEDIAETGAQMLGPQLNLGIPLCGKEAPGRQSV